MSRYIYSEGETLTAEKLNDSLKALEDAKQDAIPDTGWKNATYADPGWNASSVQYRKIGNRVYLRGAIVYRNSQTNWGTGVTTSPILRLPAECRPPDNVTFPVVTRNQDIAPWYQVKNSILIKPSGEIVAYLEAAGNQMHLGEISWSVD